MPPGKSPPLLSRCILTLLSSALSLLAVWLQLALLDALSYDKDAKSGGANGSIATGGSEELKALGLEGSLKTAVDQIRKAKEHAEKASAFPLELSMADAIVFAAYYRVRSNFIGQIVDKVSRPFKVSRSFPLLLFC